jgi:hypothetical protein
MMIDRQKDICGRYPLKVALDGGFASKQNFEKAKEKNKDACFARKRGHYIHTVYLLRWYFTGIGLFIKILCRRCSVNISPMP